NRETIIEMGRNNGHVSEDGGMSEELKRQLMENDSRLHASVISARLAANQDQAAKQYYEENKESIQGTDRIKIERELEVGTIRGEAQRQTEAIVQKHTTLSGAL